MKINSDPKAWCLQIVSRRSVDLIRKRNPKTVRLEFLPPSQHGSQGNSTPSFMSLFDAAADQAPAPDQEMVDQEIQEMETEVAARKKTLVDRMLRSLRPRDRYILTSAVIDEKSHEEIAATLKMKTNAVKCALYRIRIRLRMDFRRQAAALRFVNA